MEPQFQHQESRHGHQAVPVKGARILELLLAQHPQVGPALDRPHASVYGDVARLSCLRRARLFSHGQVLQCQFPSSSIVQSPPAP